MISFYFKKWYQEKYFDNLNFLVTTLKTFLKDATAHYANVLTYISLIVVPME